MTHDEKRRRRREIADAIEAGREIPEVATTFGVSLTTVRGCCQEHDVPRPPSRPAKRAADIAADVRSGSDPTSVAQRFGVTIATVKSACDRHGIRLPSGEATPPANRKADPFAILAALFDRRRTLHAIADDHGVTKQRVQQIHRAAMVAGIPGLPPRSVRSARLAATSPAVIR